MPKGLATNLEPPNEEKVEDIWSDTVCLSKQMLCMTGPFSPVDG